MIENEIGDCLKEMTKIQEKMERLEEEKNKQAKEKEIKQTEIEPNLKIMSDWLENYGEIIEEIENEKIIEEQYKQLKDSGLEFKIRNYEKIINFNVNEKSLKEMKLYFRQFGIYVNSEDELQQLRTKNKPTTEEYNLYKNKDIIIERYLDLREKKTNNRDYYSGKQSSIYGRMVNQRDMLLRVSKFVDINNSTPTYFMKQYIEATYNMFLIQQKRIDELERKLKKY